MAERVGRGLPGEHSAALARARQLPAAVWFVLLVAAALVVAVVVAIVFHQSHPLEAEIEGGFVGGDPRAFTFSYEVTKSTLSTSACELQAQDEDHSVVGDVTDTVGPTPHNQTRTVRRVTIPTTGQAVTAVIVGCHTVHTS